jgi:glutamate---cysteine ligase / carboxylate-amine ligase
MTSSNAAMSASIAAEPLEDLTFHGGSETTLGVEIELQILDRQTGELAPGATRILQACQDEKIDGVTGEFLLSMLEVKTDVCRNTTEVRDTLAPRLRHVHNVTQTLGFDLSIGGTHPAARASMSAVFPGERYQRMQKHQGWLAYQEACYGLHVHVGVPDGERAVGVINQLAEYLPHLIGLSANSPFWQGVDTTFASMRMRMFRPTANSGLTPRFETWDDFLHYSKTMHAAGLISGTKDLYWDLRPKPAFGTIEFRIFDAPPTLTQILGLTSLARCLVTHALARLDDDPDCGRGDQDRFWLANENRWLAARYGLQAACVRGPNEERRTLADDAAQLLAELRPTAEAIGELQFLRLLEPVDQLDTGAERQRRIYRQTGQWKPIVDDAQKRWRQDLEQHAAAAKPASGAATPTAAPVTPPTPPPAETSPVY